MQQVTHGMRQVTCDMCHVTGEERLTFSQNFSSLALTARKFMFLEYLVEKAHSLTLSVKKLFVEQPGYTGCGNKIETQNYPYCLAKIIFVG